MEWSKLKKAIESRMADSLQKRVRFHMTHYGPGHSFTMVRGWITFDKKEIFNSSNAEWWVEHSQIANQIRRINRSETYPDPTQRAEYLRAYDEADAILAKREIFSQGHYFHSLKEYLDSSFEDALASSNILIRAVAMLDKRIGKRRLKNLKLSEFESALVRNFYALRCTVEGLGIPSPKS